MATTSPEGQKPRKRKQSSRPKDGEKGKTRTRGSLKDVVGEVTTAQPESKRLSKWEDSFSKMHGRRPTIQDKEGSKTFVRLLQQVQEDRGPAKKTDSGEPAQSQDRDRRSSGASRKSKDKPDKGKKSNQAEKDDNKAGKDNYQQSLMDKSVSKKALGKVVAALTEDELGQVAELFKVHDKDEDGMLEYKEFRNAMRQFGKEIGKDFSSRAITAAFNETDADNNGLIDFLEFAVMQRQKRRKSNTEVAQTASAATEEASTKKRKRNKESGKE